MQELLLKLMNDLQILKGSQQEKKETAAQSFTPYWNFSMIDDEEARDNFLKDVCTFLRKFSRIPFGVTPKVILIAWERFGKIKDALTDKQYRQEDIQELMSKLLEDVRNIREELSEYINFKILSDLTNDGTSSDGRVIIENIEYVDASPLNLEIDNSLPKFETFSDHTEDMRSGSTTTHANNSLPEYDSFLFEVEPDQGGLTSVVMDEISDNSTNDPLLELPEFESFHFDLYDDPSFPRPPPEPPDDEICLNVEPDAPVINNFDELNKDECFYPGGGEINISQNV
ncbi:hypothetical protein Tco_0312379 [Tanacetum coccineum]